jgi:hypothetical protein
MCVATDRPSVQPMYLAKQLDFVITECTSTYRGFWSFVTLLIIRFARLTRLMYPSLSPNVLAQE